MKNIIVIAGATASGKTALGVALAKHLNGEVVSADSMQVYRGMDIGTAKPDEEEMDNVVHHMISVVSPTEKYTAKDFADSAKKCIDDIIQRGKVPIVVGGTGMYLDVLTGRIALDAPESDSAVREELSAFYEREGIDALYELFLKEAGEYEGKIHKNDVKRIIRAIERARSGFEKVSGKSEKEEEKEFNSFWFAIDIDREELYNKINKRVDMMMEKGLVEEVERVIVPIREKCTTSLQGIGYKEILMYLDNIISYDEAVELIKKNSRNYAKRQLTWFRRNDKINYLDCANPIEAAIDIIKERGMF